MVNFYEGHKAKPDARIKDFLGALDEFVFLNAKTITDEYVEGMDKARQIFIDVFEVPGEEGYEGEDA